MNTRTPVQARSQTLWVGRVKSGPAWATEWVGAIWTGPRIERPIWTSDEVYPYPARAVEVARAEAAKMLGMVGV